MYLEAPPEPEIPGCDWEAPPLPFTELPPDEEPVPEPDAPEVCPDELLFAPDEELVAFEEDALPDEDDLLLLLEEAPDLDLLECPPKAPDFLKELLNPPLFPKPELDFFDPKDDLI